MDSGNTKLQVGSTNGPFAVRIYEFKDRPISVHMYFHEPYLYVQVEALSTQS